MTTGVLHRTDNFTFAEVTEALCLKMALPADNARSAETIGPFIQSYASSAVNVQ